MSHTHMRGIAATSADSHSLLKGEMSSPLTGLFVDSEFPASVSSLVYGGGTPLSLFTDRITWRRPQDICASPHLFPENSRDSLGKQGILGDCWFICACSALQKYDHLLNQVFPSDQCTWNDPGYLGQFTCRFWHFGHWVEVTIDDLLPCLGNKLCFSHCQDQGAFWLPLLEKAYAKLHGCYEALWAGQVADALMDLTGGLVERWNLGSEEDPIREKLFSKIVEIKDKCAMSCSILRCREGNGEWGECHAFTITDIQQMVTKDSQELLLLRVHNPWGRSCWGGPWRKGGDGWAELNQTDISRLISETQEGEFWVEKTEFMQEFDEITVAFPVNEEGYLQSIQTGQPLLHTQQICGSWVKGKSAGGSRNNASFPDNPKYWLRVKEPSEVCLALMQKPRDGKELSSNVHGVLRRAVRPYRADLNAVGLHVWKVTQRWRSGILICTKPFPPLLSLVHHLMPIIGNCNCVVTCHLGITCLSPAPLSGKQRGTSCSASCLLATSISGYIMLPISLNTAPQNTQFCILVIYSCTASVHTPLCNCYFFFAFIPLL
ncbi:calpain-10 isoform 1-T2 [Rhinophrynus dorsalis]